MGTHVSYDYTGYSDPADRTVENAAKTETEVSYSASIEEIDRTTTITIIIDGGGTAITTGQKGYLKIPFDCEIQGWTVAADQSGSIVIDVWKDSYANFPPTVADTITGSEKPTLAYQQKNEDTSLTTWTTSVVMDDVLAFNVDSAATVQRVTLALQVKRII